MVPPARPSEYAPRVALQVGQLAEGLGAAGVPALVGLVARVRPDVLLQVGQLRELALADLAPGRRNEVAFHVERGTTPYQSGAIGAAQE